MTRSRPHRPVARYIALPLLAWVGIAPSLAAGESPVLAAGATLQQLAGDYRFTEGPTADDAGNVYFTDQPNDRILRWNAADGTVEDWLEPAGRANGLYLTAGGDLIVAADQHNQLWSIAPDKSVNVLLKTQGGKLLNGPNDIWVSSRGDIYFTDPLYPRDYWSRDPRLQQSGQHVYMLAAGAVEAIPVLTDLEQPNGIIGSLDGQTLYVSDIGAGRTYAYDIGADGVPRNKRLFCELGSDGMTTDNEGNVYLTGKGVTVFDKAGKQIEHIDVPQDWTANVTFGDSRHDMLFITASTAIYGIRMRVKGIAMAQPPTQLTLEEFLNEGPVPAEVLLLGTFHFKDAGLDGYVPEVDVDILAPERQREVEEVVALISRFAPTKIALEAESTAAERLGERYAAYRRGEFELPANEIYQLGFRLAARLGHERLYFVDAPARLYPEFTTDQGWQEAMDACGPTPDNQGWPDRFTALYRHEDLAKASRPLSATLLALNDERRILASHGHYLIGRIGNVCDGNYPGADNLSGWWYNRNLRIFGNIRAITDVPTDRILVIIGAGHLPILRHAFQASPQYRLREVAEFLGAD